MRGERPWKCRVVDAEDNQLQVFLRAHSPWKSLRDSHIPTAATNSGKVESQKQASHFPTALRFLSSDKTKKEAWRRVAALPAFRLILQLENAGVRGSSAEPGRVVRLVSFGWKSTVQPGHFGFRLYLWRDELFILIPRSLCGPLLCSSDGTV